MACLAGSRNSGKSRRIVALADEHLREVSVKAVTRLTVRGRHNLPARHQSVVR